MACARSPLKVFVETHFGNVESFETSVVPPATWDVPPKLSEATATKQKVKASKAKFSTWVAFLLKQHDIVWTREVRGMMLKKLYEGKLHEDLRACEQIVVEVGKNATKESVTVFFAK